MKSKNNTTSTPDSTLVPVPTAVGAAPNNRSTPLDARFTVSNPLGPDPTTILYLTFSASSNTPIPVSANTSVETTETFKSVVIYIIESTPLLISPMFYENETVLVHKEDIKKELNDAAANYQADVRLKKTSAYDFCSTKYPHC